MASTFHLGAYHELADTFTLGFQKKKKRKEKKQEKKQAEFLSFAVNFLLSPPPPPTPPQKERCNAAEISPPDGRRLYKQPPGSGSFLLMCHSREIVCRHLNR